MFDYILNGILMVVCGYSALAVSIATYDETIYQSEIGRLSKEEFQTHRSWKTRYLLTFIVTAITLLIRLN